MAIKANRDGIMGSIGGVSADPSQGGAGVNAGDTVDAQGAPTMQLPHNLVSQQPRKAVNYNFLLTFINSGVPQQFPPMAVPMGLSVTLRGNPANTHTVRVAATQDGLDSGAGRVITPDTVLSFPVDNMLQIWAVGTGGEGLIADVSGVPIG